MERPDTNYLTGPELAQVAKLVDTLNETKPPVAPLSFEIKIVDQNGDDAGYIDWAEGGVYAYYPARAVS